MTSESNCWLTFLLNPENCSCGQFINSKCSHSTKDFLYQDISSYHCSIRIRQALDCSPTNRERELGLDRRETVNIGKKQVKFFSIEISLNGKPHFELAPLEFPGTGLSDSIIGIQTGSPWDF
ncbi:hypothetical protein T05_3962 [Trichinella murrelli]|uniref:Uncharacterized protein n=1 Tax=Trichinella murrelli TaxID=144512 RepID=A0A0V0T2D9_9BILA|nr:hypothetical protein T05_3962 [Trichinella murrelli]